MNHIKIYMIVLSTIFFQKINATCLDGKYEPIKCVREWSTNVPSCESKKFYFRFFKENLYNNFSRIEFTESAVPGSTGYTTDLYLDNRLPALNTSISNGRYGRSDLYVDYSNVGGAVCLVLSWNREVRYFLSRGTF